MFSTLIASGATRSTEEKGALPSVLLHLGVIAAMVIATQATDPFTDAPRQSRIVPLFAPSTPSAQPAAPSRPRPAPTMPTAAPEVPAIPTEVPSVPVEAPSGISASTPAAPVSGEGTGDPSALPSTDAGTPIGSPIGSGVLDADGVDVPARLLPNSPLPRYPDFLRQSRLEGGVRVRFIVNENGRAELASLVVLESTHPAFVESVRAVLGRLRFTPARVGRDRVRQMVEIPFGFELR
jgi:TonB family protein